MKIPSHLAPLLTEEGAKIFRTALDRGFITFEEFGRSVSKNACGGGNPTPHILTLSKFLGENGIKTVVHAPKPEITENASSAPTRRRGRPEGSKTTQGKQVTIPRDALPPFEEPVRNGHVAKNGHSKSVDEDGNTSNCDSAYNCYLRQIGKTSLLTREQEIELANKIRNGDKSAREQMIKANLRLVVKIARDYEGLGMPLLDLISEGNIGLMKGVERFDPEHGAKLSTYASWWIKQSIKRALANQGRTIRLPVHVIDKLLKMRRAEARLHEVFGREPTDEELAFDLDTSPEKIRKLRTASQRTTSLETPVGDNGENKIADVVADENALAPDDEVEAEGMNKSLQEALKKLDPREIAILRCRYGLGGDEEKTLEEVGRKFGVTRERIRQLQVIAEEKLRKEIGKKEKYGI